jgi:hypothetical protein
MTMAQAPTKPPPFSGQLTRVTREGEQCAIAFTAHTPEELSRKLGIASGALDVQIRLNNEQLLDAASTFEERQAKVYHAAVAQLRREMGLTAPPDGGAHDDANDTAGPIHPTANP